MKALKLLVFAFLITSCSTSSKLKQKSFNINPGMSKEEVLEIMGTPSNRQFKTDDNGIFYEALQWELGWHSGLTSDFSNKDMLIVFFKNNQVTDLEDYVAYYGKIMTVRWEERPDFIFENRKR
jgi:outer membrane protein assembly factor BamE (lipoprotein component of BamABCDE complex)